MTSIGKPSSENARHVIRNRARPTSTPESLLRTPSPCNLFSSGMVHCLVVRDIALPSPNPTYSFMFQDTEGQSERIAVMMAQKQGNAIRIWDTRKVHVPGDKLNSIKHFNKKSGNYLGKVKKSEKKDLSALSLFDSKEDKLKLQQLSLILVTGCSNGRKAFHPGKSKWQFLTLTAMDLRKCFHRI